MKKINLLTFTSVLLSLSFSVKAQWQSQKLIAPSGGSVTLFGEGAKFLDNNTLLLPEPDWLSIKNSDTLTGAVFIYKKKGTSWTLTQTLSSGNKNGFASSIANSHNTLAVSAPNENVNGVKDAGALYFYKRADSTSDFVLYKKLTNPVPAENEHFGYVNDLNDHYIIISGKVYRLQNDTINALKNIKASDLPWYLSASISEITDNDYLISYSDGVGFFKIKGDSVIKTEEIFIPNVGKGGFYGQKVLDGNTLGTSIYGQDGTTFSLVTVNNDGSLGGNWMFANPYIASWGNSAGPGTMALKEKKWMFSGFSQGIIAYKYFQNQYYKAGIIKKPADYKSKKTPFGYTMVCSENLLLIHDPEDSTNSASPGSLHLMALGEFVSDTLNGNKTKYPFKEEGDNFATGLAIDNDLAIIGATDDDLADSSGTAFVYKKINGKWLFASKIAPADNYVYAKNKIGNALTITDKYFLVGAPGGLNPANSFQSGVVFVYSKNALPLEFSFYSKKLVSPQEPNWADTSGLSDGSNTYDEQFGYSIASDSIFTAISAPVRSHYKGEIYIYGKDSNEDFAYLQKIAPNNLANKSEFGHSVAIKGKYLIAGASGLSTTNGAYFYQLQGDTFSFKQRFAGPISSKPANSVALDGQYAFAAPGNGNFVQVYSLFGSTWTDGGKIVPFLDSASIEVAADNNVLLVSSNNENGKAVVARYELFGNKWLKTGIQTLGEATGSPVKVCIKGNQSVAAYKNDINSNESYALFGLTSDIINNSGTITAAEVSVINARNGILSPNPYSSGYVTLNTEKANYAEIVTIESGTVKEVLDVKDGKISPGNLTPGMYLVKVYTADGIINEKLIVK